MVEIDTTMVEMFDFSCIEGCGLCCLNAIPVGEGEMEHMKSEGGERGIEVEFTLGEDWHLKVRKGAIEVCAYLDKNRRCSIYDFRPHACRAFPVHIYHGWRLQAVVNLSCPGVKFKGSGRGLIELLDSFSFGLPQEKHHEREHVDLPPGVDDLLDEVIDDWEYPENRAKEVFSYPLNLLPRFLTPGGEWGIFRVKGSKVELLSVDIHGNFSIKRAIPFQRVHPYDIKKSARRMFIWYLEYLTELDYIIDSAVFEARASGFLFTPEEALENILVEIAADVVWRSAAWATFFDERKTLGKKAAINGIRLTDMDVLNRPTLGEWY